MQLSVALIVALSVQCCYSSQRLGGMENVRPASEAEDDLLSALESIILDQFITMSGIEPEVFEPIAFASQVVAGTNYFVKVKVSDTECAHLRVYQPLPYTRKPMELSAYQIGKSVTSPLEYFEISGSSEQNTSEDADQNGNEYANEKDTDDEESADSQQTEEVNQSEDDSLVDF